MSSSSATDSDKTSLRVDMFPFESLEEYLIMLHIRRLHPSCLTRKIDIPSIISILRRKDERFSKYSDDHMRICIDNAEYNSPPDCHRLMPVHNQGPPIGLVPIRPFFPQLFPANLSCLSCGQLLESDFKQEHGDNIVLHTHSHGPLDGNAFKRTCSKCRAIHYYSYYEVNVSGRSVCYLNPDALLQPYLLLWSSGGGGGNHAISVPLLDNHLANVVHGHITFTATVLAYNDTYASDGHSQLDIHNLTDYFFALTLLRYISVLQLLPCVDISVLLTRESRRQNMDNFILGFLPVIRASFSRYWSMHRYRLKTDSPKLYKYRSFARVRVDSNRILQLQSGEGLDEFIMELIPPNSLSPPMDCNIYGCGDNKCSTVAICDGHAKNNRSTCARKEAIVRYSPELGILRLQCPNAPGYHDGKRMNYCDHCAKLFGLYEPGHFAHAEGNDALRRKTASAVSLDAVVEPLVSEKLKSMKESLILRAFQIPPDLPSPSKVKTKKALVKEHVPSSPVYVVYDVLEVMITDDTCPEGQMLPVVYFYDRKGAVPTTNNSCEWCSYDEAVEWVHEFVDFEATVLLQSSTQLQPAAGSASTTQFEAAQRNPETPSLLRRSSRVAQRRVLGDSSSQESHLRDACLLGLRYDNLSDVSSSVDDDGHPEDDEVEPDLPKAASKRPRETVDVSYVFQRIIAETREPGGQTFYTCEYAGKDEEKKLFVHLSSQISIEAVSDFKRRLSEKQFAYPEDEAALRKQMCGNNDKEQQDIERLRTHSAGIGATLTNCGIWIDIYELLGKEGCTQVWLSWLDLFDRCPEMRNHLLLSICYDDACHLKAFSSKRAGFSIRAQSFAKLPLRCDKLHFKNHGKNTPDIDEKSAWATFCEKECDPTKHYITRIVNQEVCEQEFSWLARYKFSTHYMKPGRFLLFLVLIADSRNAARMKSNTLKKSMKKATDAEAKKTDQVYCTDCCCSRSL